MYVDVNPIALCPVVRISFTLVFNGTKYFAISAWRFAFSFSVRVSNLSLSSEVFHVCEPGLNFTISAGATYAGARSK